MSLHVDNWLEIGEAIAKNIIGISVPVITASLGSTYAPIVSSIILQVLHGTLETAPNIDSILNIINSDPDAHKKLNEIEQSIINLISLFDKYSGKLIVPAILK